VTDLKADPIFIQMSTSIPELTPPTAAWCVNQHNGGADVTIFIREDKKDLLPTLNVKVKALFPSSTPQLRIKCSIQETNAYGRALRNAPLRTIFLNDQVPVIRPPASAQKMRASSLMSNAKPPPLPGSFAAAVIQGVKRLPDISTLNHRPKKKTLTEETPPPSRQKQKQQQQQQKQQQLQPKQQKLSQHLQPSTPSQNTTSNTAPTRDITLSPEWQALVARNAEMEKRFDAMNTTSASVLQTLTRNLDTVMAQLSDQQRAFTNTVQHVMAQFESQAMMNNYFTATLASIAQKLGVTVAVAPSASLSHQPSAAITLTQPQPVQNPLPRQVHPGLLPQAHMRTDGPTSYAATTNTFSLISEVSASANPARNGSAASHG
jgi:hypothetical protein